MLYKEDAKIFVINGHKLPGMVLLISYSKDKTIKIMMSGEDNK